MILRGDSERATNRWATGDVDLDEIAGMAAQQGPDGCVRGNIPRKGWHEVLRLHDRMDEDDGRARLLNDHDGALHSRHDAVHVDPTIAYEQESTPPIDAINKTDGRSLGLVDVPGLRPNILEDLCLDDIPRLPPGRIDGLHRSSMPADHGGPEIRHPQAPALFGGMFRGTDARGYR